MPTLRATPCARSAATRRPPSAGPASPRSERPAAQGMTSTCPMLITSSGSAVRLADRLDRRAEADGDRVQGVAFLHDVRRLRGGRRGLAAERVGVPSARRVAEVDGCGRRGLVARRSGWARPSRWATRSPGSELGPAAGRRHCRSHRPPRSRPPPRRPARRHRRPAETARAHAQAEPGAMPDMRTRVGIDHQPRARHHRVRRRSRDIAPSRPHGRPGRRGTDRTADAPRTGTAPPGGHGRAAARVSGHGRRGQRRSRRPPCGDRLARAQTITGEIARSHGSTGYSNENPGDDLFSQGVAPRVSSALESLTSVFGMGTGGASPLASPGSSSIGAHPSG